MAQQMNRDTDEPTGWVGWILFAAIMMMIGGSLNILYGLVAVLNDTWVGWANRDNAYLDLTTWGWLMILFGTIVLLSGFGVLTGNVLARTVGVLGASIQLIANFFFIPVYPLWAITVIVIDSLIIWALIAHGGELRDPDRR